MSKVLVVLAVLITATPALAAGIPEAFGFYKSLGWDLAVTGLVLLTYLLTRQRSIPLAVAIGIAVATGMYELSLLRIWVGALCMAPAVILLLLKFREYWYGQPSETSGAESADTHTQPTTQPQSGVKAVTYCPRCREQTKGEPHCTICGALKSTPKPRTLGRVYRR